MCKRLQGKSPSYLPTLEQHLLWSKVFKIKLLPWSSSRRSSSRGQRLLAGLVLELADTYWRLGMSQVLSHQIVRSTMQGANFTSKCGPSRHWKESGVAEVSGLHLAAQSSSQQQSQVSRPCNYYIIGKLIIITLLLL